MQRGTVFLFIIFILWMNGVKCQLLSDSELKKKPVFTSIEEAAKSPQEVYRMKLKIKADTLPDELFQFTNLQELVVSRCKLSMLSNRIGELTQLQRLDVSANHLVVLPESICRLVHLKELIINRNIIAALPEGIGAMEKLLPETKIQYTSTCDCHSTRGK